LETLRPDRQQTLPAERRIVVTPGDTTAPAQAGVVDAVINISGLSQGGFEKLRLQSENRIEFRGLNTLNFERGIRLDAPQIELAPDANVQLLGWGLVFQTARPRALRGCSTTRQRCRGSTPAPDRACCPSTPAGWTSTGA
jgi:hypothetical protein